MFKATMLVILLATSPAANTQTISEDIHTDAQGPSTMCGMTGRDANELMTLVRASRKFKAQPIASTRFEVFSNRKSTMQWVLTKRGEYAYPAASCREFYTDSDGGTSQKRDMRCDASREACDRLFAEFQQLDQLMIGSLRNR
jgi:hypothetical protein